MKDFKFIIVFDGEDPHGVALIERFADPRIKIIVKPHSSQTDALNLGLEHCKGVFLLRQDSDDYSTPDRLRKLFNAITDDATRIVCVGDNYGIINNAGEIWHINTADPETAKIENLAGQIAGGAALYRTDVIREVGGWKYDYAQDFYMLTEIRKRGYRIVSLKDTVYYYRQHPGQISQCERESQKRCGHEIAQKAKEWRLKDST